MGGSSEQYSNSHSSQSEGALTKAQTKILENRENIFNTYFLPEYQKALASTSSDSAESKAQMAQTASQINQSAASTMKQTNQNLAQQGLLGSPSGVQAALVAKNNRAKASNLANAYYSSLQDNSSKKNQLLQIGAGLMPSTTTNTTITGTSESHSGGYSWNVL